MGDQATDYKALVDEAREYTKRPHLLSSGDARTYAGVNAVRSVTADFIGRLADAVEALLAENEKMRPVWEFAQGINGSIEQMSAFINERDALRAQLDNMTTEWGVTYGGLVLTEAEGYGDSSELENRAWIEADPSLRLVKRIVGSWVEATD